MHKLNEVALRLVLLAVSSSVKIESYSENQLALQYAYEQKRNYCVRRCAISLLLPGLTNKHIAPDRHPHLLIQT